MMHSRLSHLRGKVGTLGQVSFCASCLYLAVVHIENDNIDWTRIVPPSDPIFCVDGGPAYVGLVKKNSVHLLYISYKNFNKYQTVVM